MKHTEAALVYPSDVNIYFKGGVYDFDIDKEGDTFIVYSNTGTLTLKPKNLQYHVEVWAVDDPTDKEVTEEPVRDPFVVIDAFMKRGLRMSSDTPLSPENVSVVLNKLASHVATKRSRGFTFKTLRKLTAALKLHEASTEEERNDMDFLGLSIIEGKLKRAGWETDVVDENRVYKLNAKYNDGDEELFEATIWVQYIVWDYVFVNSDFEDLTVRGTTDDPMKEFQDWANQVYEESRNRNPELHETERAREAPPLSRDPSTKEIDEMIKKNVQKSPINQRDIDFVRGIGETQ